MQKPLPSLCGLFVSVFLLGPQWPLLSCFSIHHHANLNSTKHDNSNTKMARMIWDHEAHTDLVVTLWVALQPLLNMEMRAQIAGEMKAKGYDVVHWDMIWYRTVFCFTSHWIT